MFFGVPNFDPNTKMWLKYDGENITREINEGLSTIEPPLTPMPGPL